MYAEPERCFCLMKNKKDSRLLILRFKDDQELKKFYRIYKESGLGSLVKIGDDDDYENNKSKEKKGTLWSKWNMKNLDDKNSEKTPLA